MAVSSGVVEMFVPRLFGDQPLSLSPAELTICWAQEIDEPAVRRRVPVPPRSSAARRLRLLRG